MPTSWTALVDHARAHHATIGWHDAELLGIAPATLDGWCRQGRLTRAAPGAYTVAGSPPTWHQAAAVAATSTRGWASHRTAAALWGLDGFPPRGIEVVTPYARRRARQAWAVHESRRLAGVDLAIVDGVPCTSVARTVLDLPAVAHAHLVGQALDHACRRWPGMLECIVARFHELAGRGRRGTRLMRSMLDERLGQGRFTESGFEAITVRLVRAIGLPAPTLQHTVRDGDFVARLDLAWPAIMWAVECDSLAFHSGKRAHEWDRLRRRRLKRLGWDLVEVTYDDVTARRLQTSEQLRSLYAARARSLPSSISA
jgi:hypothetical protein